MMLDDEKLEIFTRLRPRLYGIAYRMLGTPADADDILQEAYLKWHTADADEVEIAEAWLVTVVTRLSIDRLRRAYRVRETYIGPWLPEPLLASTEISPQADIERASDISLAFMLMLERLSATERAVFLLHDVFDTDHAAVAETVGKSTTAVRQILHRARERVHEDRPRFQPSEKERLRLIEMFAKASLAGDQAGLTALFSENISMVSDGGGIVNAARRKVFGAGRIANLFSISGRKHADGLRSMPIVVNGEIGLLTLFEGRPFAVTAFEIEGGRIAGMKRVMNPDKLSAFENADEKNISEEVSQFLEMKRLG